MGSQYRRPPLAVRQHRLCRSLNRRTSCRRTIRLCRQRHLQASYDKRARVIRNVSRRLERLEARAAVASARKSFSFRIHLVDQEKGLTGVLVLESDKPTME